MSLYRFKSRETGDLVMLKPHGQRILEILGKDTHTGIIQHVEMPAAIETLRAAVVADEANQKRMVEEAQANGEPPPEFETVGLRMRCAPFIEMLERCGRAQVDVVWGV